MNRPKVISGIQQIGIGNTDVVQTTEWYRRHFGMDIQVFDDEATADLMLPYTGGKPHDRRAILSLSMRGGGGFEIWQYTSRKPTEMEGEVYLGDLGINAAKIKSVDVQKSYEEFNMKGLNVVTSLNFNPIKLDFNFVQEKKHIGQNEFLTTGFSYDKGDQTKLSFKVKRNLITNSSEFYDLSYEYYNDCLRAGLVFRREFYSDRDVEPSDSLMFRVTLFPFGEARSPLIDR